MRRTDIWLPAVLIAVLTATAGVQPAAAQGPDLTGLSLQDLLDTEITSVSRKEQRLSRTAAAVYVITQEDIRRSGATTLADLLRMVPGFTVSAIDASRWAVSARGSHGVYANKLLVLLDGRSVYSPMFGGVHWEMQDLPLADIDRIEVVRGPGGTIWGANAVNGVINIMTKPADATVGGRASVAVGSQQRGASDVRYGGTIGSAYYRAFARYSNRRTGRSFMGFDEVDGSDLGMGGLRVDWRGRTDTVSVLGTLQEGRSDHLEVSPTLASPLGATRKAPVDFTDGYTVFSWTRSPSSRSERGLQVSYQGYRRAQGLLEELWQIVDIDARQRLAVGNRHELVAGAGYRHSVTRTDGTPTMTFNPAREHVRLATGFIQDELALARTVHVTPGAKFEHNTHTGLELQPGLRMTWQPTRQQAVWGAVNRAVRTPARADRSLDMVYQVVQGMAPLPVVVMAEGNPEFASERLRAVEVGYRRELGAISIDATAFRNNYSGLRGAADVPGLTPGLFEGQPVLLMARRIMNAGDIGSTGVEVAASWSPASWWKVSGAHAWLRVSDLALSTEEPSPAQTFHVRSYVDLPRNVELNALFNRVSAVDASAVPAYSKLDANVTWHARPRLDLALGVQNLLHGGEIEGTDLLLPTAIPVRTALVGSAAWRF